ncbi:Aste57867_2689 [Aphanomyces stellatus]|uniref:Aste57867_2689 protein n=1 Tax=Aphanomyces stellatus TaxID=120398 RepID=A0A485K981_9STRA|nr:hypothetical protein As57867_002682 [Aphanomyces stellatus]VFT79882.1 Aste57867_2689 [Aphanomyces stellatus]
MMDYFKPTGSDRTQDMLDAAKAGRVDLLKEIIVDVNAVAEVKDGFGKDTRTALMCASEHGREDAVRYLLMCDGILLNLQSHRYKKTALMLACEQGHVNIVHALLECSGIDVNLVDNERWSAMMLASEKGHIEVVRALLACSSIDVKLTDNKGWSALMLASEGGHEEIVLALVERDDVDLISIGKACQRAIKNETYNILSVILRFRGDVVHRTTNDEGKLLLECCAKYLHPQAAMHLLLLDPPIEFQDGNLLPRQNHSFSWTTLMDVTHPVPVSVRQSCVASILNNPIFESCYHELLQELAFAKDQHGREVIQITDAITRQYFYDRLFYCGRYQIFEGPPVHVSSTAVVVMAYDHGICTQVFQEHANSAGHLNEVGFVACSEILGRVVSKNKKDKKVEKEKWQAEFQLWDKDTNGMLSEDEFLRYCAQHFGGKIKVAMKFMKNADEYQRENQNREDLDPKFVLSLLPCASEKAFRDDLKNLRIHGGHVMTNYPFVMVMPAADRSLEDIFLKERPGENERRILLQQVAEGLQHLHETKLVHGDVKKLNVVRVRSHLKLIDLDASTTIGNPMSDKFSSGSLPPEMFYKLRSDTETELYCKHWENTKLASPDLWQKIKPKNQFVVKTFRSADDQLPYKSVKAHPSLDVWAFGALMYQMYSGEELVSTDVNQDVLDDKIEQAATWTQEKLNTRLQNKVSNAIARELLEKLLVVDPEDRISMDAVLDHSYFKVDSSGLVTKKDLQETRKQIQADAQEIGQSMIDGMTLRFDQQVKQLVLAKEDIMRGMFEATEVTIPTSFVILPVDLTKREGTLAGNTSKDLDDLLTFMCKKAFEIGAGIANAIKDKTACIPMEEPMYLYLVDEVDGAPVVPTKSGQVYPVRIDILSPQFLAAATPYLQTGLRLLRGINTVQTLAKCIGISNPAGSLVKIGIQMVEAAQKKSSVMDFDVVQAALQAESETPVPVQRIRGAALRELERFFKAKDQFEDFAGLRRTYTADGHALWTSAENAQKIEGGKKIRPETITGGGKQLENFISIYKDLLDKQTTAVTEMSETFTMPSARKEDGKELMSTASETLQPSKVEEEKVCSCELM